MRSSRFTVISLGGGVQSSVMALMANEGAFDRIPDCAIFADTRWEPPSIYEHLTWLRDRLSFPLYVVDNGRSLREDVKALTNHSGSRNYVDIPVYLKGRGGEGDGIGRRQCTDNYKIRLIRRRIRELLGLKPRQRVPAGTTVELWLGISTDEAIRMKTSRDRWMTNRYPLIEAGMPRSDCLNWWMKRYDRPIERSAPDRVKGGGKVDHVGGMAADLWRLQSVPSAAIHRLKVKPMDGGMDVSSGRVSAGPQGGNGGRHEHPGGFPDVRVAPGHGAQDGRLLRAAGLPKA